MAAFARSTFDAAGYLAHRPRYPRVLVDVITKYHSSPPTSGFSQALDIGCGPGQLTTELARDFDDVLGLDPSEGMVKKGMRPEEGVKGKVRYEVGFAEDLKGTADASVDLIAAGQAAHWFTFDKAYKEFLRVLKPGGSVALVGYAPPVLPDYPKATNVINEYNERRFADYWEPGRKHVNLNYDTIPFPSSSFTSPSPHGSFEPSSFSRTKFDLHPSFSLPPSPSEPEGTSHRDLVISHRWKWTGLKAYLKTWSAVHTYDQKHGKDREGNGVAERFFEELCEAEGMKKDEVEGKEVTVAWPSALLLMKKRA